MDLLVPKRGKRQKCMTRKDEEGWWWWMGEKNSDPESIARKANNSDAR